MEIKKTEGLHSFLYNKNAEEDLPESTDTPDRMLGEVEAKEIMDMVQRLGKSLTKKVLLHKPGSNFDLWEKNRRYKFRLDEDGALWQTFPGPEHLIVEWK